MRIELPAKRKANEFPDSIRHRQVDAPASCRVLVLKHDNHEAENDAFYISKPSTPGSGISTWMLTAAVETTITPEVVIDDDEEQKVTVKKGTSSGPTTVYESAEYRGRSPSAADPQARGAAARRSVLEMLDLSKERR